MHLFQERNLPLQLKADPLLGESKAFFIIHQAKLLAPDTCCRSGPAVSDPPEGIAEFVQKDNIDVLFDGQLNRVR